MRYPPEHKAQVRRTILDAATRAFRAAGIDTLGIGSLMRRVGMTHGGFYKHFASKDALVGEACAEALSRSGERMLGWSEGGLEALVEAYLSAAHRDDRAQGCTAAALGGELARQSPEVRAAFERQLAELVGDLGERLERDPDDVAFVFATLVGALTISRAVAHRSVSDRILSACRDRLASWAGRPAEVRRAA